MMPIVEEERLLYIDKYNKVYVKGKQVFGTELNNLQTEAKYFDECDLWKLIVNYMNADVSRKVFEKSQTPIDLVIGKAILYTLDVQKKIIDKLKNAKIN
jgi:hypothetical protein